MLVAKPVVDKQFWILQENDRKIGNVQACDGGYQVRIHNQVTQFPTMRMLERQINVKFESTVGVKKPASDNKQVHGYPTVTRPQNAMWDLKLQAPIYTKTAKSKSWFAAGWYCVRQGRNWTVMQDPKLIVLQRYAHSGPYHTCQEAQHESAHTEIR